jgi:hypothetical protein
MSKVKIQGNASGTGVVTLTAPNTNTDRTITLPDSDITLGVGIDDNAPSTAITIDASEKVLIGGTNTLPGVGNTTTGHAIYPDGRSFQSKSGNTVASFNRNTNDGGVLEFRKDGTTVGSIGTDAGYVHIANGGSTGLRFTGTDIRPCTNTGANQDGNRDLGDANARFKDLYLSGGVYLGGTAAANALDDYEEGSWTPTLIASGTNPTVTYTKQEGKYTKVGNKVTLEFDLRFSAHSGGTGNALLGAFPFPNSATYSAGVFSHVQNITLPSGKTWTGLQAHQSNAYAQIKNHGSNVATGNTLLTEVSSNCILIGAITYLT